MRSRLRNLANAAFEALLVAVVAIALALVANAVSPRGLRLSRDYFPNGSQAPAHVEQRAETAPPVQAADDPSMAADRLARHGLATATTDEMLAWWRDPQFRAGLVVFIDARDEEKFRAGHIPGARAFNHYRAEEALPKVLPACLAALKVVVYCAGGDCEDSEFAAVVLRDAGVPRENLVVYVGGIAEWSARDLPLETGTGGATMPTSR